MKKFILLAVVSSTFIMCKKGEVSQSQIEDTIKSADSVATVATETVNSVQNSADKILDSANVKIKEYEETKEDIKEKIESTTKSIDSLSDKIASVKLESRSEKKKDSTEKKPEKIVVNVPAPKVIKETKVVYKDQPKNDNYELNMSKNRMMKTGTLELSVNDAETAKEIVKEEVRKYDGYIKSENISLNSDDKKTAYLKVKVPIQKFEYLIDDIGNLGQIENKGIEVSGQDFAENTMCDLEVTLYGTTEGDYAAKKEPETFGEKSFAAISSGWNVITSIFLFLLPLWPLFIIVGIGYYLYKKRKTQDSPDHTDQNK
ncbi:DUF4349 domain-containing protein [Chryseobacterium daecheongense]|uniref:DUF4349 domain-containing protein n=1 Tax=Chryseobacterium daecheongense TaxID=192389 RepID=A0A3N0VZ14_9FLAO|nr:DUF4349 domain-containing protein [Chryseobacterium daecheongense]ROH98045.1 DUF4349 domain-containing protein [Chryseobacterium daecheongense]TDX92762.1 uncharacterized protein DUF4349 [Chryseobacterium daecheongense]